MGHLTFWSAWVLKQLKSGAEVIFYILICSNGTAMWVCIKDSCKQLFLLQDSVAQSETVCLDFKRWNPKGAGFWRNTIHNGWLYENRRLMRACQKIRQWNTCSTSLKEEGISVDKEIGLRVTTLKLIWRVMEKRPQSSQIKQIKNVSNQSRASLGQHKPHRGSSWHESCCFGICLNKQQFWRVKQETDTCMM